MPRFSLKHLFICTMLVAAGLASVVSAHRVENNGVGFWLWFAAGPLLGAGILTLLKRPFLGFVIGLGVSLLGVWRTLLQF